MKPAKPNPQSGFSVVEVMVALTIISVGIIGTLSMVGANRAIMESTWAVSRSTMIADGVMTEIAVRAQRNETLPSVGTYDWSSDTLGLGVLFRDNGYSAAQSTLTLAASSLPGAELVATLIVKSPNGRTLTRSRVFYNDLKTP